MTEVINAFLLTFVTLFPIVNPIGSAPIFLALTQHLSPAARRGLALRIAINGFCLLVGAMFVGSYVLEFFGISLAVVRIGGGLVVVAFGWTTLNGDNNATEQRAKETGGRNEADPAHDAFYPLTLPLTVGPGSIAIAIAIGSERPTALTNLPSLLLRMSGAVAGAVALVATVYVCYRSADRIVPALGTSGTNVLTRLTAFILLCIGLEIIWSGYSALINP